MRWEQMSRKEQQKVQCEVDQLIEEIQKQKEEKEKKSP